MEEGIAGPFRKADFDINAAELDFSSFVVFLAGTSTKAQRSLKKQIRDLREAFELFDDDRGGRCLVHALSCSISGIVSIYGDN